MFIILIFSINKRETFTCNRNLYYTHKIFRPYRMIIKEVIPFKKGDKNIVETIDYELDAKYLNTLIKNIKVNNTGASFTELKPSTYNYKKGFTGKKFKITEIEYFINKLYEMIKVSFENKINNDYGKMCPKKCEINRINYRIKRLGKINSKLSIDGQLLLKFTHSTKIFLLDFIITDKSGDINIEKLELTGLDFYQTSNVLERSENDIIHNHLNIFGSPLYGRYTLPKTHMYSSLE
jgi:hypothetical protein